MLARPRPSLRLVHVDSGQVLAERLERPRSFLGRGLGLMFRPCLAPGTGMWIVPCSGIHTFFMRFPIDVVFLDRRQRVVRVYPGLRRWRLVPLVWRAHSVVELPAGTIHGLGLRPGDELSIETAGSVDRLP